MAWSNASRCLRLCQTATKPYCTRAAWKTLCCRWRGESAAAKVFHKRRLERAIGVLYLPATERQCHYLYARLANQFDAVVHVDTTGAVTPLDPAGEAPETYPAGV